jgi:hypothetical protein
MQRKIMSASSSSPELPGIDRITSRQGLTYVRITSLIPINTQIFREFTMEPLEVEWVRRRQAHAVLVGGADGAVVPAEFFAALEIRKARV